MDILLSAVQLVNSYLSDYVLITLLVGTGIYFSIRTRFVQIRCFGEGAKLLFSNFSIRGGKQQKGISSFQALATAVAAQVGTGNIVGASGAILTGGPGAIFWMWVVAFLGMSTIYAEAVLAQETRETDAHGEYHGGPAYYIRRAFPNLFGSFCAFFFSAAIILSLGFIGCMVQANSIGETMANAFHIRPAITGTLLALTAIIIFIGGVSRLAAVTEKIVPLMAFLYLTGGAALLAVNWRNLPETFGLIFKYAFTPEALLGGGIGSALKIAVSQGVKRGLFSNEAGMGSTPHAHALASSPSPHHQGVLAMTGVFIDTFVVLTMTALVVISVFYTGDGVLAHATGANYQELLTNAGLTKTNLVQIAFSTLHGDHFGDIFVAVCLFFFAFSTIISWNFFGKTNFRVLFGGKAVVLYSCVSILCIFAGTLLKNDLVWELQDMFNQLMVIPNVIALWALGGIVGKSAVNPGRQLPPPEKK